MANIHESGKSERTSGFGPGDKRYDPPDRRKAVYESKDRIGHSDKAGVDSAHVSRASKYGKTIGIKRKGS